MKALLCNLGLMILLIAPFILIPAAAIGLGLFLFGNEDVALWVCGSAAAGSLILGPLTFRTFAKGDRQTPGSLRRDRSAITEPWVNFATNACECDVKHSQTREKRDYVRYEFTWPGTFFNGRANKLLLVINLSKRGCSVRTQAPLTCGDIGPMLIEFPNSSVPLRVSKAVVRWAKDNEYGLEFIAIDQEDEHRLSRQLMSQAVFADR